MQRLDRDLLAVLQRLRLLMAETDHALALALMYKKLHDAGQATYEEVRIAYKLAIRILFTFVDATGTVLREFTANAAPHQGLPLSGKWQRKLQAKRLGTAESVKVAFRFFPQVFSSAVSIDVSGREWRDFQDLAIVRHRMTHPRVIDDTLPPLGIALLTPVATWFLESVASLLLDAAQRRGLQPPSLDLSNRPRATSVARPPDRIFDDETLKQIAENQSRTLEYVKRFFFALADETRQVTDWFGERFSGDFDTEAQFGARILTISMYSEMEGVANAAQFLIESALESGAVTVAPGDLALLEEAGPATRYANVLTLWSMIFGDGTGVERKGAEWRSVGLASGYRDRFIHPASAADLRVSLDMISHILTTMGWFNTARSALTLNPDKWVALAWGIKKAAEESSEADIDHPSEPNEND